MALDTITAVTDDVSDNLASYANEKRTALNKLMPSTPYAGYGAASSMTGNVTLTDADLPLLSYSPTAARDLTLPAVATTNHPFYVFNRSETDAITVKNASAVTITTVAAGGNDVLLSDGTNGWYALSGGSSGLTVTTASVTTSNVTGVVGTLHNLDVSGMTANRDFNLPTPSAAGLECAVRLSVGDATYALLLKANSAEITRIFITNEIVVFVSTGTGAADWAVKVDGRIPCVARITNSQTQTISNGTTTTVTLDESVFDNAGGVADTANNRLVFRRANKYILAGALWLSDLAGNASRISMSFIDNAAAVVGIQESSGLAGGYPAPSAATIKSFAAGDNVVMKIYHNSGSSEDTYVASGGPHLEIAEILT